MKKVIAVLAVMAIFATGCSEETWEKIMSGSKTTADISEKGELVGNAISGVTGGYGGLAAIGFGAVTQVALALAAFAKNKQAKKIAKAAVDAADLLPGGGKAIVASAGKHGVHDAVRKAHDAKRAN